MNCRKGELAFTHGLPWQIGEANDRIVRVVEACHFNGEPAWTLEQRVDFTVTGMCRVGGVVFMPGDACFFDRLQDKYLRPIRGLDAPESTDTPTFTDANALA